MSSVLESLPNGGRVAVVRLRSMGDCILSTPALAILNAARPDLRIAIVVEDRFRALFEHNPAVTDILAPEVREIRQWRPDLCLNLHGGQTSTRLTLFSGARIRAGFAHFRYAALYHVRIPRAQKILGVERTVHTAEHLASAMFYLGSPRMEIGRAKLFAADEDLPDGMPAGPYAVLHPAASANPKTWPAARFAEIAAYLRDSLDLEPVFIGGAGEDTGAFRRRRMFCGAPLTAIKALMSRASLFVGNDSGPAHMAAACGVPAVVIFGASDPEIWGPWRAPSEVVTAPGGIAEVSVRQVMEALERLRVKA